MRKVAVYTVVAVVTGVVTLAALGHIARWASEEYPTRAEAWIRAKVASLHISGEFLDLMVREEEEEEEDYDL